MDWRDYYFAPFGSRFFHRAYGLPMPMLFPQIGQLLMRGGGAEEDEHDGYNEVAPKWLRRMQRAGIAGPMIGRNDTYSAAILPPWMAPPGWQPRGGFYNDPMRAFRKGLMREVGSRYPDSGPEG